MQTRGQSSSSAFVAVDHLTSTGSAIFSRASGGDLLNIVSFRRPRLDIPTLCLFSTSLSELCRLRSPYLVEHRPLLHSTLTSPGTSSTLRIPTEGTRGMRRRRDSPHPQLSERLQPRARRSTLPPFLQLLRLSMGSVHIRPVLPEPPLQQRHQNRSVDGDHAYAGLAEPPAVSVDDRGRSRERAHGADERGGDHEDAREQEQRDADLASPRHAEPEEVRGRDGHDGEICDYVEDDDSPEVLGAKDAF